MKRPVKAEVVREEVTRPPRLVTGARRHSYAPSESDILSSLLPDLEKMSAMERHHHYDKEATKM